MNSSPNRIFAFDVGTGSLGIAVREGREIVAAYSLTLPEDFASVADQRVRRRQMRTRRAHRARENWLKKQCREVGIEVLEGRKPGRPSEGKPPVPGDPRLEREFPKKGDDTIYTSCLLRIKLLQGEKLESWQIYKALHSAIQRRGYDKDVRWKRGGSRSDADDDRKESLAKIAAYRKELKSITDGDESYMYPCYYDAFKMGLWDPKTNAIKIRITHEAQRARGMTAPRSMVEREIRMLLTQAARQYPKLKERIDQVIYGPAGTAYASFDPKLREKYHLREGGETDWNGVLGQKIPRFDNRVVSKCALMPRYNVCRASDPLVMQVTFLLKLMNMRFHSSGGHEQGLDPEDVRAIFQNKCSRANKKTAQLREEHSPLESGDLKKVANCLKFTKNQWKKWLEQNKGGQPLPNHAEVEAPRPTGRSRFCRPALRVLRDLILSGRTPGDHHRYALGLIEQGSYFRGVFKADLKFLDKMPKEWASIHVPQLSLIEKFSGPGKDRKESIRNLIASHKDPIVRHRLSLLNTKLDELTDEFGPPDHVTIEFIREDFMGTKALKRLMKFQTERRKERERAREKAEELGVSDRGGRLRLQLLEQQGGQCLYTGRPLSNEQVDNYEIDHAVPRGGRYMGSDSILNKVLTHSDTNAEKGAKTPFEYVTARGEWRAFCRRVEDRTKALGRKKVALLTSENPEELDEKYTSLAETAWIARSARSLICLKYGWQPGAKGKRRKTSVINGNLTAKVRRKYHLDRLLAPDETDPQKLEGKNRKDARHHALDAMVLSYIPEWTRNPELARYFALPPGITRDYFGEILQNVVAVPVALEKPHLEETLYAARNVDGGKKAVKRVELLTIGGERARFSLSKAKKTGKNILDRSIREQVLTFLDDEPSFQEWKEFVAGLRQSRKGGALVRKVAVKEGDLDEYADLSKDRGFARGQYRRGKSHSGQFLYSDSDGRYKVRPVYVHESEHAVEEELGNMGVEIVDFFWSNCLINLKKDVVLNNRTIPAGDYVMSSMRTDRQVKLKGSSEQLRNPIWVKHLMKAGMSLVD